MSRNKFLILGCLFTLVCIWWLDTESQLREGAGIENEVSGFNQLDSQPIAVSPVGRRSITSNADNMEVSIAGSKKVQPSEANAESSITGARPYATRESQRQLRILSWNVESEGSDPKVIARQLGELPNYDIVALSEVLPESFDLFQNAVGGNFASVRSKTGNNDRLQIIFDIGRFQNIREMELHDINNGRHRSPLVVHLKDRQSGQEFLVMNNHLARGNADFRTQQAEKLVDWARNQTLPLIAVGDYNFDFVFETERGNEGFKAMRKDNIWHWVRPQKLIDSNWYDPESDGVDNYPGSILDFAFVSNRAIDWNPVCNVLVRTGDFPDDRTTSDHRPFELILSSQDFSPRKRSDKE